MKLGGGLFLLICSVALSVRGLYRLFKAGSFGVLCFHLAVLFLYPVLTMQAFQLIRDIEDPVVKIIAFTPFGLFIPAYLMWGFFVNKSAEKAIERIKKSTQEI